MKRTLSTVAAALVAMVALAQKVHYNISGTCPKIVHKVYVYDLTGSRPVPIDSAAIVDNKFELKGTADKDALLGVSATPSNYSAFFNDGTPITFDASTYELKGSELNNRLNAYDREIDALSSKIIPYYMQLQQAELGGKSDEEIEKLQEELEPEINKISDSVTNRTMEIIKENEDNLIPVAFINSVAYDLEYPQIKELLDPKHAYSSHPALAGARQYLGILAKKAQIIGSKFIDITENDVNGKPHKLSEYCGKGNYVLIDFWASWCGPCRGEMPNVKANYEKYKSKGFNIVGLSFDNKLENWKKAIDDMQLGWVHLSDLKGWQTLAGQTYGINSIPASLLVAPDGTIVDVDLRGDKLGNKLKEIYGE